MPNLPLQSELVLKPEVRHLLDDLAALMKLRAVFFSADGREIERGRNAGCSEYCRLMQNGRFSLQACLELDAVKRQEALASGEIKSYICHAGLGEIIAPVMLLGQSAGFLVMGQFRVFAQSPGFELTEAEQAAYLKLPLLTNEEIRNLIHMVKILLDYIVTRELVTLPQDLRMLKLQNYLEKSLKNNITLAAAAKAVGCSESTLTHYLKSQGTSFSKLLTAKRIERAKKLLKSSPHLTNKEISEAVGFNSEGYFSRVFKSVCGISPGSCRNS
ncbi:MAG: helix-turn-helix domain-containing protein [Lentisphaerae bacterium]|nr:helix-turn-helix domain-containing protein [Lentisphaerota bacterium]